MDDSKNVINHSIINDKYSYKMKIKPSTPPRTRKANITVASCKGCRSISIMEEIVDLGEDLEPNFVKLSNSCSKF